MNYQLENSCYVLLDGLQKDIPELLLKHKHDLILYPERGMRLVDRYLYRPYVKSIVTESSWLIGMYSKKDVWVLKNNVWVHPDFQTFGTSRELIEDQLFGITSSIPLQVISSKLTKEFNNKLAYPSKFVI
jgi:hypothetical protein